MDELRRISIEYYKTVMNIRHFGFRGGLFILCGSVLMTLSTYASFKKSHDIIVMALMMAGAFLWRKARNIYDIKLIKHISYFTHHESKKLAEHKSIYLSILTSHIANSLFDAMKTFKEIIETDKRNRSFELNNLGSHFSRFLYDPESKNRILSLFIYLISLITLLVIGKQELPYNIYDLIISIHWQNIVELIEVSIFFIIMIYFTLMIPIMFVSTFIITPLLLHLSNTRILSKYFISELNKYAYLENSSQFTKK